MNPSFSHGPGTSRRAFLRTSLAASAFAGVNIIPRPLLAAPARVGPNDKVRLAVIGCGNRGGGIGEWFLKTGQVEVRAVCDVDLEGRHVAGFLRQVPSAPRYTDFRRMFDERGKEIDAVLVGTPDHSHFPISMLAMSLGKHVYVEKPMAHTFHEIELMTQAARKHGVVTQMGNQGHSEANYFQFKAWTDAGIIKNVRRVDAYMVASRRWHNMKPTGYLPAEPMPPGLDWDTWLATAPEHPYNKKLHPAEWRSWYDYGSGAFGDWGPHILDTIHRFLDLGLPEQVAAVRLEGRNDFIYPQGSVISFKFPARGPHPALEVKWYDGKGNRPPNPPGLAADDDVGDAGKFIYSDTLVFRGGSHGSTLRIVPESKFREMRASLPDFPKRQSDHALNFVRACRGEEPARSNFDISGPLAQTFSLGIIAQRLGGGFRFDRATRQIVGNPKAQQLLAGNPPRKGWEQYYKM